MQQYTQDGSLGTPDFGNEGQATCGTGEFTECSSRERAEDGTQPNGGRTEKKQSAGGWKTTSDLVDVDTQRTDGQGREKSAGMNKLAKGIPPEFADVALDYSGKKWFQKSAEWNLWYWIYNS